MKKVFVKTQNVKNFITLINSLQHKPDGVSRMALVYGEPGLVFNCIYSLYKCIFINIKP